MPKMARWPRLSGVVGEQVTPKAAIQPRSCLSGRVNTGLGVTVIRAVRTWPFRTEGNKVYDTK
jgi:hypothetical protein